MGIGKCIPIPELSVKTTYFIAISINSAVDVVNIVNRHERSTRYAPSLSKSCHRVIDHPDVPHGAAFGVANNAARALTTGHRDRTIGYHHTRDARIGIGIASQGTQVINTTARDIGFF